MKLKSALPKGDADGVSILESRINKNPDGHIAAVVILDVDSRTQDNESKEWSVALKIRRIEAILNDDIDTATQLVRRAFEARTGDTTLPIELENDLKSALEGVDLYEPETGAAAPEPVIDVPESGYAGMTVPLLTALLRKRGLDATSAKKAELIARLEANDADPEASKPKTNVTNLFSDGESLPVAESIDASAVDDANDNPWLQDSDTAGSQEDEEEFMPEKPFYSEGDEEA